jgi:hypothetical protein
VKTKNNCLIFITIRICSEVKINDQNHFICVFDNERRFEAKGVTKKEFRFFEKQKFRNFVGYPKL